jgi:hypothetical protein
MSYVVIEFPTELRDAHGCSTGTNRGWIPDGDPVLPAALAYTREIARTDDLWEAQRLVEEGCCLVAQGRFDALVGLEITGVDPVQAMPAAWAHLRTCTTCRAAYEARLAEILQNQAQWTEAKL